jgi:hypothetical protein
MHKIMKSLSGSHGRKRDGNECQLGRGSVNPGARRSLLWFLLSRFR